MRQFITVLILLLILWIAGSSYWYVCRVRGDCRGTAPAVNVPEIRTDAVLAPELTPEQALRASVEEAKTFLMNSGPKKVYFRPYETSTDMNVITTEYLAKLKLYLDNQPDVKVKVSGHTDNSGPRPENVRLSRLRAEFVQKFLISSGIKANQIEATSRVDSEPEASNDTPEGRVRNRRAEIKL